MIRVETKTPPRAFLILLAYVIILPLASPFGIGIYAGNAIPSTQRSHARQIMTTPSSNLKALPSTLKKIKSHDGVEMKMSQTYDKDKKQINGDEKHDMLPNNETIQKKEKKNIDSGSKRKKLSILSRLFFFYVSPIVKQASERELESSDFHTTPTENKMGPRVAELQQIYDKCRAKAQTYQEKLRSAEMGNDVQSIDNLDLKRKMNDRIAKSESLVLAKALIIQQKNMLIKTGLLRLLNTSIQAFPALLVARLLKLIESGDTHHITKPLQAAVSLVGVLLLKMIVENQYFHNVVIGATQVRGSLSGLIFDKTLRLSSGGSSGTIESSDNTRDKDGDKKKSTKELGSGGVLNLMQSDASTIELAALQLHTIWDGLLQISIYTALLFRVLGPSVLWGLGLLLLQIPTNSIGLRVLNRLTAKQNKAKDARTKKTTESISNMKLLKLQAWEKSFETGIREHRDEEIMRHVNKGTFRAFNSAISNAIPAIILVVTLAAYKRTGRPIVASTIFTAISLFNQLRFPLFFYPMLIDAMANGKNSLRRISSYLNEEELSPYVQKYPKIDGKEGRIIMQNGNFLWSSAKASTDASSKSSPAAAALCGAEVDIKAGEIVAVVGPVGSGKSSIVKALLGELQPVPRIVVDQSLDTTMDPTLANNGELPSTTMDIPVVSIFGDISYCAQESWLSKGTIREAVVFGREYDEEKYLTAIYDAGLDEDILGSGSGQGTLSHDTEVGEGGSSLSGGQRARVQLARAFYEDGGVYILDDPLSALDASVGATVFERMTKRLKERNAAAVFVTNDPSLPRRCDRVILMGSRKASGGSGSHIVDSGTYDELIQRGHSLRSISSNEVSPLPDEDEHQTKNIMINGTQLTESVTMHADPDSQISMENEPDFLPEHKELLKHETSAVNAEKTLHSKNDTTAEFLGSSKIETTRKSTLEKNESPTKSKTMDEMMKTGAVPFSTYVTYMKSVKSPVAIIATLACVIMVNSAQFFQQYVVAKWTELGHGTAMSTALGGNHLQSLVYAAGVVSVFLFLRGYMIMKVGARASKYLHSRMLATVFRAPVSFFDKTPSGQLLTRFGKEMEVIDRNVPDSFASLLYCVLQIVMTFAGLAGVVTPRIALPLVVIALMYNSTMGRFRPAARDLKRYESKSRSPIYTHFGEALRGAETIRSFHNNSRIWSAKNRHLMDDNLSVFYTMKSLDRWLSIRLEALGNLVVLSAALGAVIMTRTGSLKAGNAGWGLTQALSITGLLAWTVRVLTDLESQMMSVTRVLELANESDSSSESFPSSESAPMVPFEKEATGEKMSVSSKDKSKLISSSPVRNDALIKAGWPWKGAISFKNASMRYNADSPLVLKNVSISVPPGSTLGVVGRTGSGKSSLLLTLFRITELEEGGSIEIDGIDIGSVSLQTLRESLAIIPQDPVLFSGSVMYNLDATGKSKEEDAWEALETASPDLAQQFRSSGNGLNSLITEGGKNLSSGQRQLICLARALLRKSKILVLDEATSSVDSNTDAQVQDTIRKEFVNKGVSVITVAHRLDTVLGSDKILVLGAGEIVEYGAPQELLRIPNGDFRQLVDADKRNKKRGASKIEKKERSEPLAFIN